MSKNIAQVYSANPITSNASTDLMYFGQSPYGVGNDAAMLFSDFSAQFGAPYTAAALTRTNDTNVTLTLGGSPTTALLHAASLTLGWTGTLSGTRGGTGVNNGASTITIGGNVTFSGAFTFSGTITGNTSVTFPTSGTLATTSQIPSGAALTKTDDTNVTLTLGGSPNTALLQATSLTLGWSGQLSVPRGGSGASSFTAYSVICGGTTSTGALQNVSGVGSAGQVLTSNGAGHLPTWQAGGGGGSVTPQDIQNQTFLRGSTTNIGNDYSLTLTTPISSYVAGQLFSFVASSDNTNNQLGTNATLDVDGLGPQPLTIYTFDGNLSAQAGTLISGSEYQVVFDGSQFVILNPSCMALGQQITNQSWTYSNDSGAADSYVLTVPTLILDPIGNLLTGAKVCFKAANANTGPSTITLNALSPITLSLNDGTALVAGNIILNGIYEATYNGSEFNLLNPSPGTGLSFVTSAEVQQNSFNQGIDSGIADAYDIAVTPSITSPYPGMLLTFVPANGSLTNAPTVALNGGTAISVTTFNGAQPNAGDFSGNIPCFLIADATGSSWQLINPNTTGLLPRQNTQGVFQYYADQGMGPDVYVATAGIDSNFQPPVTPIAGTVVYFESINTNTGPSTLNLNGSGDLVITFAAVPLTAGQILGGCISILCFSGAGTWNLLNPYA